MIDTIRKHLTYIMRGLPAVLGFFLGPLAVIGLMGAAAYYFGIVGFILFLMVLILVLLSWVMGQHTGKSQGKPRDS
jgi:hypothetical protein